MSPPDSSDAYVQLIPLSKIDEGPNLLRQDIEVDSPEMVELKASIQDHGILQPVGVFPVGGRYQQVFGFRRATVARLLNLTQIPAMILKAPANESDLLAVQIQENAHRVDVEPVRFAQILQQMLKELGCSQKELSQKLHLSPVKVSRLLSLAALSPEVQSFVAEGRLGISTALELGQFQGVEQADLLSKALAGNLSRDEIIGRRKAKSRNTTSTPIVNARIAIPVDAHCTLALTGIDKSMDAVIDVLQSALAQAKKARTSGLSLATFARSQADRHRTPAQENPT
jgi:ParB-like partition proteins